MSSFPIIPSSLFSTCFLSHGLSDERKRYEGASTQVRFKSVSSSLPDATDGSGKPWENSAFSFFINQIVQLSIYTKSCSTTISLSEFIDSICSSRIRTRTSIILPRPGKWVWIITDPLHALRSPMPLTIFRPQFNVSAGAERVALDHVLRHGRFGGSTPDCINSDYSEWHFGLVQTISHFSYPSVGVSCDYKPGDQYSRSLKSFLMSCEERKTERHFVAESTVLSLNWKHSQFHAQPNEKKIRPLVRHPHHPRHRPQFLFSQRPATAKIL